VSITRQYAAVGAPPHPTPPRFVQTQNPESAAKNRCGAPASVPKSARSGRIARTGGGRSSPAPRRPAGARAPTTGANARRVAACSPPRKPAAARATGAWPSARGLRRVPPARHRRGRFGLRRRGRGRPGPGRATAAHRGGRDGPVLRRRPRLRDEEGQGRAPGAAAGRRAPAASAGRRGRPGGRSATPRRNGAAARPAPRPSRCRGWRRRSSPPPAARPAAARRATEERTRSVATGTARRVLPRRFAAGGLPGGQGGRRPGERRRAERPGPRRARAAGAGAAPAAPRAAPAPSRRATSTSSRPGPARRPVRSRSPVRTTTGPRTRGATSRAGRPAPQARPACGPRPGRGPRRGEHRAQRTGCLDQLAALPPAGDPDGDAGRRPVAPFADGAGAWAVATPHERAKVARQRWVSAVVRNRTAAAAAPRPDPRPFVATVAAKHDGEEGTGGSDAGRFSTCRTSSGPAGPRSGPGLPASLRLRPAAAGEVPAQRADVPPLRPSPSQADARAGVGDPRPGGDQAPAFARRGLRSQPRNRANGRPQSRHRVVPADPFTHPTVNARTSLSASRWADRRLSLDWCALSLVNGSPPQAARSGGSNLGSPGQPYGASQGGKEPAGKAGADRRRVGQRPARPARYGEGWIA
jgi:hypothetical protein